MAVYTDLEGLGVKVPKCLIDGSSTTARTSWNH